MIIYEPRDQNRYEAILYKEEGYDDKYIGEIECGFVSFEGNYTWDEKELRGLMEHLKELSTTQ